MDDFNDVDMGRRESKFFDSGHVLTPVAIAGNVKDSIVKIPQGVGDEERVGRQCRIDHIEWHVLFELPKVSSGTEKDGDCARMILFVDTQCNGAVATAADILDSPSTLSFYNLSNKDRFVILVDKIYDLTRHSGTVQGGNITQPAELTHTQQSRACNIPMEYSGTTGALTEMTQNNVGALIVSALGEIWYTAKFRVRYSD